MADSALRQKARNSSAHKRAEDRGIGLGGKGYCATPGPPTRGPVTRCGRPRRRRSPRRSGTSGCACGPPPRGCTWRAPVRSTPGGRRCGRGPTPGRAGSGDGSGRRPPCPSRPRVPSADARAGGAVRTRAGPPSPWRGRPPGATPSRRCSRTGDRRWGRPGEGGWARRGAVRFGVNRSWRVFWTSLPTSPQARRVASIGAPADLRRRPQAQPPGGR